MLGLWYRAAHRPAIYNELEFSRRLDWRLRGLGAEDDCRCKQALLANEALEIGPVGH